jgi:methyl-accepting chemotaxis protein
MGAGSAALVVLMLCIVAGAQLGLSAVGREIDTVIGDRYLKVKFVTDIGDELDKQARSTRNPLIIDKAVQREHELGKIDKSRAAAAERYKQLQGPVGSEQGEALLATVLKKRAEHGEALEAFAALVVTRSVTRPVGELVATLQKLSTGDLNVSVGELQRALSSTVTSLRRMVGQVRSGVDSVTTASSQIAAGNQDLSSRTEQQASSLQETASSMEQLASIVGQSADHAQQASRLAAAASAAAGRSGQPGAAGAQPVGSGRDLQARRHRGRAGDGVISRDAPPRWPRRRSCASSSSPRTRAWPRRGRGRPWLRSARAA